jgi:glutathione S-transferase
MISCIHPAHRLVIFSFFFCHGCCGYGTVEGGMTLYLKAGPDGTSVGDCPFAHFVRLVLEEKGLDYTLQPCTADTKPNWLVEHYQGKMPALRHRKECYTESGVIGDYLEFFFPEPSLQNKGSPKSSSNQASLVLEGFFPAVAQYIKAPEGQDGTQLQVLQDKLAALNNHFVVSSTPFLEGSSITLMDCRIVPQLYHLQTAIEGFKQGIPNVRESYPEVADYYERCASRPSFQATLYPKETVLWGWGNARKQN